MNKINFLGHPSLEFLLQYAYEIRFEPFVVELPFL